MYTNGCRTRATRGVVWLSRAMVRPPGQVLHGSSLMASEEFGPVNHVDGRWGVGITWVPWVPGKLWKIFFMGGFGLEHCVCQVCGVLVG